MRAFILGETRMTDFQKAFYAYLTLIVGGFLLLFSLAGCSTLREGENRKITAWGIWAVVMGAPIGIGYWHSERGPDVESEQSAQPKLPIK